LMTIVVAVVVLVSTAPCTRLFKLAPALLCLTAVLTVTPDFLIKVRFGFANALFALVVTVAGLQRYNSASQQECAQCCPNQSLAKHIHTSTLNFATF
ncbi:MAG: hypothetical protein ACXVG9_09815, partial [Terriglobales bacterium]